MHDLLAWLTDPCRTRRQCLPGSGESAAGKPETWVFATGTALAFTYSREIEIQSTHLSGR